MSDLLTHEEYVALASSLDLPKSPFIDGIGPNNIPQSEKKYSSTFAS